MYEMSEWMFDVHNLFKKLDRLTSEQSYRRIFDDIDEFVDMFNEGVSPQQAYEQWWD